MLLHNILVYLPFLAFLAGMGAFEVRGIHAGLALSYWLAKKSAASDPDEGRVFRWNREVYGSRIWFRPLERSLLFLGLGGCFSVFGILLTEAWCGIRGILAPSGTLFSLWFLGSLFLLSVPVAVLQFRWKTPLRKRQEMATVRIFGTEEVRLRFAAHLREKHPEACGGLSLWAFPMGRSGVLSRFQGAPFWFFLATLVALFFSANTVSAFIVGVWFLAALLVLPLNFYGFLVAFGDWAAPAEREQMVFPVAVFLDSARGQ
jgi:hypothetical protein